MRLIARVYCPRRHLGMAQDTRSIVVRVLQAAQTGDIEAVKKAVIEYDSEHREISMCRNKAGDTPMLLAARHGHLELLKYLHKDVGLSIEQANFDHKRSLHEAAGASQLSCMQYLLRNNAEVNSLKRADW